MANERNMVLEANTEHEIVNIHQYGQWTQYHGSWNEHEIADQWKQINTSTKYNSTCSGLQMISSMNW